MVLVDQNVRPQACPLLGFFTEIRRRLSVAIVFFVMFYSTLSLATDLELILSSDLRGNTFPDTVDTLNVSVRNISKKGGGPLPSTNTILTIDLSNGFIPDGDITELIIDESPRGIFDVLGTKVIGDNRNFEDWFIAGNSLTIDIGTMPADTIFNYFIHGHSTPANCRIYSISGEVYGDLADPEPKNNIAFYAYKVFNPDIPCEGVNVVPLIFPLLE